jgi:hypothetical protein
VKEVDIKLLPVELRRQVDFVRKTHTGGGELHVVEVDGKLEMRFDDPASVRRTNRAMRRKR